MTSPADPVAALYQAVIVDHGKRPRHRGGLAAATHTGAVDNPLCGDEVTLRLRVDAAGRIAEVAHDGHGCALSIAAASVLSERLLGATPDAARALAARLSTLVEEPPGAPIDPALGDLAAFAGVREFRSRRVCATLVCRALSAALDG
jgi:nitrogen fixation NifU-like protein